MKENRDSVLNIRENRELLFEWSLISPSMSGQMVQAYWNELQTKCVEKETGPHGSC